MIDDRGLRAAENVTPLIRTEVMQRGGPGLAERVDSVSRHLTTDDLRGLNAEVESGSDVGDVASSWLTARGLR